LNGIGVPVKVESARLAAMGGFEADAFAIKLMDERGLNIRDHRAPSSPHNMG